MRPSPVGPAADTVNRPAAARGSSPGSSMSGRLEQGVGASSSSAGPAPAAKNLPPAPFFHGEEEYTDGASSFFENLEEEVDEAVDAVGTQAGACAMLFVASCGDLARLSELYLGDKQVIHFKNSDSRTSVHVATCEGHLDVVKWLLARGCDVNARDRWKRTPLDDAIRYRFYELQDLLLEKGGVASTPLPPRTGKGEKRHLYMSMPDDVIAQCSCMVPACTGDYAAMVAAVTATVEGLHDMHYVRAKDYDARTLLHLAATCPNRAAGLQMATWLVDNGADINARDRWDKTPYMRAVAARNTKMCDYLLKRNAEKPNVTVEKAARIHEILRLAANGNITAIKAKYESDPSVVNVVDFDGRSVLHYAAFNNQIELAKWLIASAGANPNLVNRFGATPLQCIRTQRRELQSKELVAFLMTHGGKLFDVATGQLEEVHTLPAATCKACQNGCRGKGQQVKNMIVPRGLVNQVSARAM